MTLTEFLLARWAEDDAGARHIIPEEHWPTARLIAETEALRQRLSILSEMESDDDNRLSSYAHSLQCREALPYACHPDYREEWRA